MIYNLIRRLLRSQINSRSSGTFLNSEPRLPVATARVTQPLCQDCELFLSDLEPSSKPISTIQNICQKCSHSRKQRRELIIELVREEISYGEEIRCLQREVSDRLVKSGLITSAEYQTIFGNLAEIVRHNANFLSLFREEIWKALQNGDQTYHTLEIGRLFNESYSMFLSYEAYCNSVNEKVDSFYKIQSEKNSVKAFVSNCQEQVSEFQNGPAVERWLLKPLQRLIRYPILLEYIRKLTPRIHIDWMNSKRAVSKINFYLKRIRNQNSGVIKNGEPSNLKTVRFEPKDNIIDWPKLACRELESETENTTLLMADFVGFEKISLKSKVTKRRRKYVAMLVILSNYSHMYLHNRNKEVYLLVLKEVANNDFMTIRKLNITECSLCVEPERPLVLEVTEIATSEVTAVKFSSAETAEEWMKECRKFAFENSKWNKRRNAMGNIMLGVILEA